MLEVKPLSGALAAEVRGVDLASPLDAGTFDAIHRAFLEHLVLVFPEQSLSPQAQVALTERFGPVEPHPLAPRRTVPGHPGVLLLETRPGSEGPSNDFWHSDISHAERPPMASFLHALEVPEARGDTMWCNMYAALESLSPALREALRTLRALHSGEATARRNAEPGTNALPVAEVPPPVEHPVVRTHPETGREALYVNPFFTVSFADMTEEESRPLLEFLYDHATRPENVYRHRWRRGDLVVWDNRCTMHYAVKDYDDSVTRVMQRTTAAGDRPR